MAHEKDGPKFVVDWACRAKLATTLISASCTDVDSVPEAVPGLVLCADPKKLAKCQALTEPGG